MPRLIALCLTLFLLVLLLMPVTADAFNAEYRAAGVRLHQARTETERARALADMARAASRSKAEGAELVVEILTQQAKALANDADFQEFLARMSQPNVMQDSDAYAKAMAPLLRAITRTMRPTLTDMNAVIRIGDAINKHDERAKAFGLPGFKEIAARLADTGETQVGLILNAILGAAEFAKQRGSGDALTDRARRKAQDRIIALLPDALAPYGPALPFARDQIRWSARQYDHASDAVDLVTDAMETGRFDSDAYNRVRDEMLDDFRRGPWDRGTYQDALTALCKKIVPLAPFCKDIFDTLAEIWEPEICTAINCDCGNVGGGLLRGEWTKVCKSTEAALKEECRRREIIVGTCHNISGPAAVPPFQ